MITGIFIVLLLTCVGFYLNYVNLYTFVDSEHKKIEHFVFTYWLTWIIPFIPILGVIIEIFWIFVQYMVLGYKSYSKILQKH